MKVLYDHQTFTIQNFGGISRYFYELIKRGQIDREIDVDIALKLTNNAYLNEGTLPGVRPFFPNKQFRGRYRIMEFLNKRNAIAKLKKGSYDIVHPTYYDPYFYERIKGKAFTITFLDMIHEKFGSRFGELAEESSVFPNKKFLLERADKVIAISESTKNDIVEIFNIDPDRVKVIYLGSSFNDTVTSTERLVQQPYLLYVGKRSVYKNFNKFFTAVSPILRENSELVLVAAGGGAFTEEELQLFKNEKLDRQLLYFNINDDKLKNLYKYAELFVFPSLYEGFGIPVLEAFSLGCPIAISNSSSLPEVGGNAAAYFDPESEASIHDCVNKLLHDSSLRKNMISKGYEQGEKFSWDKMYEETKEFYKSLI